MSSCATEKQKIESLEFSPFNKPQIIRLSKLKDQGHIWSISLNIKGKFNGETHIATGANGRVFNGLHKYKNGLVEFDTKMSDWYTDEYYLKFIPIGSDYGKVTISYQFHD